MSDSTNAAVTYGSYLKVDELLSLWRERHSQTPQSQPDDPDGQPVERRFGVLGPAGRGAGRHQGQALRDEGVERREEGGEESDHGRQGRRRDRAADPRERLLASSLEAVQLRISTRDGEVPP